jgi:hypothetical protein
MTQRLKSGDEYDALYDDARGNLTGSATGARR